MTPINRSKYFEVYLMDFQRCSGVGWGDEQQTPLRKIFWIEIGCANPTSLSKSEILQYFFVENYPLFKILTTPIMTQAGGKFPQHYDWVEVQWAGLVWCHGDLVSAVLHEEITHFPRWKSIIDSGIHLMIISWHYGLQALCCLATSTMCTWIPKLMPRCQETENHVDVHNSR
jgi:hypothetical protein